MRTATAHERHRAHHTRPRRPWVLGLAVALPSAVSAGCGSSLPRPPATQVSASDYVAVPFPPRPPPVEFIPPSPAPNAVWVDGTWAWTGDRYGWRFGTWVLPPAGARHARWVVVRRPEDGQLFFAPSTWKDASGNTLTDTRFLRALGARARARSRTGNAPLRGGDDLRDRGPETVSPQEEDP